MGRLLVSLCAFARVAYGEQLLASPDAWIAHLRSLQRYQPYNIREPTTRQAYLNFLASMLSSLSFVCDGGKRGSKTCVEPFAAGGGVPSMAVTMAGHLRMKNVELLLRKAESDLVKGSFVEAGVWRGGMSIYAAAVMRVFNMHTRRMVYLCDSFQGLPAPRANSVRTDETYYIDHKVNRSLAVGERYVRSHFESYGIPLDNVVTVPGYFVDSLPLLREQLMRNRSRIAVLRLDGDMYDSTVDILYNLYDLVAEKGCTGRA